MTTREHARRFHFLREIASGGFGTVHLVKVMHADGFSRLVAVKLLKVQWTDTEEVARRMRDEARLLGLLRHRNIVDVIDLVSIDGRAAVVMEYLEAVDLRQLVQRLESTQARLPVKAALQVAAAVASALDAAYNRPPIPGEKPLRVIHRDIKPSNIMLDESGQVKVLDFGVARSEIENRESHTQDLQFGSVDYMAPERLFFEPETPASDVYSLGATLFEVLFQDKLGKARGRPERHQAFLVERIRELSTLLALPAGPGGELEALLLASLAFNHEERPTAAEFFQRARVLSRLMDDEDLAIFCERNLPPLVSEVSEDRRHPSPLDDTILVEDSKAFGAVEEPAEEPANRRPTAEELRRGALAELEESGDRMVSMVLPTGAPATGLRTGASPALPVLDEWDDGPTHIGEAPELPFIDAPLDTEEAIGLAARDSVASDLPPDPADPFSALSATAILSVPADAPGAVLQLDRPIPLWPVSGRAAPPAAPQLPRVDCQAPWPRSGPPGSPVDPRALAPIAASDDAESPTVLMVVDPAGGEVRPLRPDRVPPLHDEDSATVSTPRAPGADLMSGPTHSVTVEVGQARQRRIEEAQTTLVKPVGAPAMVEEVPEEAPPAPPRRSMLPFLAAGCLVGVGVLAIGAGALYSQLDRIGTLLAGDAAEVAGMGGEDSGGGCR